MKVVFSAFFTLFLCLFPGTSSANGAPEALCAAFLSAKRTTSIALPKGCHSRPEVVNLDGQLWVLKEYICISLTEEDVRALDWLEKTHEESDPVKIVPFFRLEPAKVIHPFIHGKTVKEFLEDPDVDEKLRDKVSIQFQRFQILISARARMLMGEDGVNEAVFPSMYTVKGTRKSETLQLHKIESRRSAPGQSITVFPHDGNIIVEDGTNQLWLIDPR